MKPTIRSSLLCIATGLLLVADPIPGVALTSAEADGVLYMKQEEKLARDVYRTLAARWDIPVFRSIATAEQRHMDAIDGLVARYGLTDPTPAQPGKFSVADLQQLHDDLVARGLTSLEEALKVGVAVEEADIADLKEALASTAEAPIVRVYGNLLRASTRHLEAFSTVLSTGNSNPAAVGCPSACPKAAMDAAGRAECKRATGPCDGSNCPGTENCAGVSPKCDGTPCDGTRRQEEKKTAPAPARRGRR